MADTKLTDLSALAATALGDKIYIVDVSDTTDDPDGSSKYVTVETLLTAPTVTGTLTVLQTAGTPGTDQVEVYHDGSSGYVKSKDGFLQFFAHNAGTGFMYGDSTKCVIPTLLEITILAYGAYIYSSEVFGLNSTLGTSSPDVAFYRIAANVAGIATSHDKTGRGWLQLSAGEAALESAYTDTDATLANTALSITVIAGRSYRIEGYLIISNSVAGEGFKCDFDGGTATATTFDVALQAVGANTPATVVATALATDLGYSSVTGTNRVFVRGYLEVDQGGTFILRASENSTGGGGTMTLAAGSWIALFDTVDK